nr:hypothetical protein [Tanacetum cinerariifolium]
VTKLKKDLTMHLWHTPLQVLILSLPPEWNMHVVVWRNKPDLESIRMDDLYNDLKVYEPEVKGVSSSSTNTQNMAFVSFSLNKNTNSSNEAVNTAFGVTAAGTQVNAANSTNIDNMSDAIICAFLVVKKDTGALIIEDWKSDDEDEINAARQKFSKLAVTVNIARPVNTAHPKTTMNAAKPRITKTIHTDIGTNEESRFNEISKKIKLEDLSNLIQDTRSAFLTLDSPQDEPIIISDKSEEEETERYKDNHTSSHDGPKDTLIPDPSSPKLVQIQELMAQSKIDMGKAVDDDLVVTKRSGTKSEVKDDISRLENDTDADDADIRPIYDEERMVEISTGKLFDSCISKVDSEPPHGSNVDISKIHKCKQTLDLGAGTSINVQKEQSLDLSSECSSCGDLCTTDYCCSDGSLRDKIICDLNKTPDFFQEPPQNCPKCGNPVDGHYCQGCALLRKKLKEDLFTYCIENGILQDFLDASEPSNGNTNVANALQEPFIVKQDPGKNSSQSPPHINHHCCYRCGDSLEDIFCHQCTCESYGKVYINSPSRDRPTICYNDDDDEDCTIAITPILSTKEPDNSLSMGNEHLDTISETKSDEFIKSSVENLVPIPSESEGIPDNMCDVPFHDNSPPLDISKDQFEDFFDSNDDSTSIDDDSFSIDNIEYVEASPPDSEFVSLEVVEIVIPKIGGIDADILLTIKDDILREKLLNVNLLIAKIKALKDNPTPSSDFITNTTTRADISLPDYEAFYDDHVKEISSGSTTTHSDFSLYESFIFDLSINPFPPADRSDFYHEEFADKLAHIISPPEYNCFSFKNEPNSMDFSMDVVEDIFPTREPRVHVHNVFSPIPTFN